MDDLISRKAAIETITNLLEDDDTPVTELRFYDFGLKRACEILRDLPSAQPEHLQTVMKKIKEKYEKGMNTPCINKPMAWALYETWKEYDR